MPGSGSMLCGGLYMMLIRVSLAGMLPLRNCLQDVQFVTRSRLLVRFAYALVLTLFVALVVGWFVELLASLSSRAAGGARRLAQERRPRLPRLQPPGAVPSRGHLGYAVSG